MEVLMYQHGSWMNGRKEEKNLTEKEGEGK